ncbi:MAG TPA: SlyX family protein [Burkholderiaceae bacterium]
MTESEHDDRLTDIEIKLTRQEDLLETLNNLVYRQQMQIDQLQQLCGQLTRHVTSLSEAAGQNSGPAHELPPHY